MAKALLLAAAAALGGLLALAALPGGVYSESVVHPDRPLCGDGISSEHNLLGVDINKPSESVVDSSWDCCDLCAAQSPTCRAWSWHRITGQCALKASPGEKVPSDGFISAELLSGDLPQMSPMSTLATVAGVSTKDQAPFGGRPIDPPIYFSKLDCGTNLKQQCTSTGSTRCCKIFAHTDEHCCNKCKDRQNGCYGWSWNNCKKKCHIVVANLIPC